MGEVYRARDTKLGRDVAIKVLPSSIAAQPDRVARFEREARLLASVNHPHIGAIYGVEEAPGLVALVLELVDGETLAARIARKAAAVSSRQSAGLPLAESLDIARQIAEALDAAHERGIVHRDLKPANVAITHEGIVKVLDFGLARDNSSADLNAESLTHSPTMMAATGQGVLLGTAPYMSPEQARGKGIDQRSDVFSAGAVFYYMLSGRKPFTAHDLPAVIHKVNSEDPPPLSADESPPGLARVIMKALAKSTDDRYADMGALLADLVRFERDYDRESRTMALVARQEAVELARLVSERLALADRLGVVTDASESPFSDELLDRYPVLEERGPDALGVVPFRRATLMEIREGLDRRRAEVVEELQRLRHMGAVM